MLCNDETDGEDSDVVLLVASQVHTTGMIVETNIRLGIGSDLRLSELEVKSIIRFIKLFNHNSVFKGRRKQFF